MVVRLYDQNSYLSATDLNRIEENIYTCYNLVFGEGVPVTNVRTFTDILTAEDLNRIEGSILDMWKLTQDAYEKPKTNWKAGDSISYVDLNRIEMNIKAIYETYSKGGKVEIIYPGAINKYLAQQFL